MINILIKNSRSFHQEIILSVIEILIKEKMKISNCKYFFILVDPQPTLTNILINKYNATINNTGNTTAEYDYIIECTTYPKDKFLDDPKYIYICHEISKHLIGKKNIWFLTPLMNNNNYFIPSVLPEIQFKKTNIPTFVVQGSLYRRNILKLIPIFETYASRQFIIKFLTRDNIPTQLLKYKNKIELIQNADYINFHRGFEDAYAILALVNSKDNTHYYVNKLTSSISYAIGYNLLMIYDIELHNIYNLQKSLTYNTDNEFIDIFGRALDKFT